MAAVIAQVITFSGVPVFLKDVDQAQVDAGIAKIRKIYQRRFDREKMTADDPLRFRPAHRAITFPAGVRALENLENIGAE